MRVLYTAEATVGGGRSGHGRTFDGRLEVDLSIPAEMGGDGGPGTNPEQLFAAGYAACFHSATRFTLKQLGLSPKDMEGSSVTARVSFLSGGPGDFGLGVELALHAPGLTDEQARQ